MFLHLRKAFDVIDHSLLRQKLTANGTSGSEHAWFLATLPTERILSNVTGLTQMRELSPMESPKDPY